MELLLILILGGGHLVVLVLSVAMMMMMTLEHLNFYILAAFLCGAHTHTRGMRKHCNFLLFCLVFVVSIAKLDMFCCSKCLFLLIDLAKLFRIELEYALFDDA